MKTLFLAIISALTVLAQAPDVIYYNAAIITMSPAQPDAQALAIRGDRFITVGSNQDVLKTAGPRTQKIDLGGKCVVPGIIETHVHPIGAALSEIDGPVPVVHSIAELKDYIQTQDKKLPPGRLIFVPKVYSTRLADHRYPTRYELDEAAPAREVVADNGYAAAVNSALLKKLGITRETPQPGDGRIAKDDKGEPTGVILGAPQLLRSVRGSR